MNDQVTKQETTEILHLAEQCLAVAGDYVELGCYKGMTSVLLGKLLQEHTKSSPHPISAKPSLACGKPVENSQNLVEKSASTVEKSSRIGENYRQTVENTPQSVENPPKRLWIYDSFAGLPAKTREDASGAGANFQAGELLVTKREVIDRIKRAGLHNVVIKKAWFDALTPADLPEHIAFAFCDGDLYSSIKTSLHLVAPRLSDQGIIIVHDYNNPELPGSARAVDEFLRAHPAYKLQVRHTLAILTR